VQEPGGAWARRVGGARWAGLAALAVVAAALLVPAPAPDGVRARGLAQLLRGDAERAAGGDGMTLFASLARLSAAGPLGVEVRVGGTVSDDPALESAARAALRHFQHLETPRLPELPEVAPPGGRMGSRLVLDVVTRGEYLFVRGMVRTRTTAVPLRRIGPWVPPGRASLLPPLVAIGAAVLLGRTLLALFLGVAAGAVAHAALAGAGAWAPVTGLLDVFRVYLWRELTDTFRFEILGFIVALLAMVGVMSRAGGVRGLVERAVVFARSVRSTLVLTWGAGLLIFFDDYANCMLVGSTLRPLADRLRISREKLAFVVDSTAAPVAGVSLLSTWIAFQVSVFAPQLPAVGIEASGYAVFLQALPYRFYCWLTLFFVLAVALSGRDFGPMARAEARARHTGALVRPGGRPPLSDALARMDPAPGMRPAARRAVVPLLVTVAVTLLGILVAGGALDGMRDGDAFAPARWSRALLEGSGAAPLFAGALAGLAAAVALAGSRAVRWAVAGGVLALGVAGAMGGLGGAGGLGATGAAAFAGGALASGLVARHLGAPGRSGGGGAAGPAGRPHLPLAELARAAGASGPTLGFAAVLLFEAWMLGAVCADLATADYLVALLSGVLPVSVLPVLLFAVGALVAFSTGSSWSAMSILLPNAVPLAGALAGGPAEGVGAGFLVALAIGAVLDGAIFGDHCSPLSDTTVMSSVASGSDHLDHVRTQAPYAASVAVVAVAVGYLPLGLWPAWDAAPALLAGAAGLVLLLVGLGRPLAPAQIVQ